MVVKILILAATISSSHAQDARAHSQRYLSIYANDVTSTFADYDQIKELMRKYFAARQAGAEDKLREITSSSLFATLKANPKVVRNLSINPDLIEVRDLAIYSLNKKTLVQFDIFDLGNKRSHSMKSWFSVVREPKGWIIEGILEHFDPDAGP